MTELAGGYLLVETQVGATSARFLADGLALAAAGARVWLFLAADAVGAAVGPGIGGAADGGAGGGAGGAAGGAVGGVGGALAELLRAGVGVWVDEFTLTQRALPRRVLADGVRVATMDSVAATLLADGVRTVWH